MHDAIAITGVGVVSPAGLTEEAFWHSLATHEALRGKWPKRALSAYPIDNVIAIAEQTWRTLAQTGDSTGNRARLLADFAVAQALAQAHLPADGRRLGCLLASTTAGVEAVEDTMLALGGGNDPADIDASTIIPQRYRWSGPTGVISNACSSGLMAPALAIDALRAGEADVMIAGGVDVLLEYTICGFNALRLASDERCRPFNAERKGVVLSEGAACFCLEPLEAARARGAPVRALVRGYGISCDADHVTAPNPAGVARAIRQALDTSALGADTLGGVFAHGTGTVANDAAEVAALRAAFDTAAVPPVTSIKSVLGHPQAAAGAFSLLAAILALDHACLPATAGLDRVDPELNGLDVVSDAGTPLARGNVMVNAFGFGGNNCVMIVSDARALAGARRAA